MGEWIRSTVAPTDFASATITMQCDAVYSDGHRCLMISGHGGEHHSPHVRAAPEALGASLGVLRLKEGDVMLFRWKDAWVNDLHPRLRDEQRMGRHEVFSLLDFLFKKHGNGATYFIVPDLVNLVQHLETADPLLFALERAGHSKTCIPGMAWGGAPCSCGLIGEVD